MFLLKIGVPQTRFKIALTWSSSKGRTLDTRRDSSLSQGEDEEVADGLSDNTSRYPKRWISTVIEQGDKICRIKYYNDVCSRKNIHNLTLVEKGCPK